MDGVAILNTTIRGRGIFGTSARYGRIEGNDIHTIDCSTGGGVWLGRFSDGWTIRDNRVHDLAASVEHSMSEGIRFSGAAAYNLVERNVVEDIPGLGRGIATDVYSSWNTIRANRVSRTEIGFSEQLGGWGNSWTDNVSDGNRRAGFYIYWMGASDPQPTTSSPAYLLLRCNRSRNERWGLYIGGVQRSAFEDSDYRVVKVTDHPLAYWSAAGNTWESRTSAPSPTPASTFAGCPSLAPA
ncbi:MAG: right-handed parallel beta-helix repeat-containing protein [Gemmatimonadetes bacterium]|nr:right-handed parallel beta-helix repeat-containing protein [Gemmatimonadota bacterium]